MKEKKPVRYECVWLAVWIAILVLAAAISASVRKPAGVGMIVSLAVAISQVVYHGVLLVKAVRNRGRGK